MHLGSFCFPVKVGILNDAQGVYPDIPNVQGPRDLNSLLEVGGQQGPFDSFLHETLPVVDTQLDERQ